MKLSKEFDIIKYSDNQMNPEKDEVIIEFTLKILINSKPFVNLVCSPKSLEALVVGFLFSEEIITKVGEIERLQINEQQVEANVDLYNKDAMTLDCDGTQAIRTITTACGKMHYINYPVFNHDKRVFGTDVKFNCKDILTRMNEFNRESELFKSTGGVHSCCLCNAKENLYFEEDIGRHNAIDKVVGKGLLDSIDFSDTFIVTSGRVPSDVIRKVLNCGIPLIVSRSAPTDKAIVLAKAENVTLIGFARGGRMNIYCGQDRLEI